VLAAMDNIAGQTPQAEGQARTEIQQRSDNGDHAAKDQQGPSKFAEWVHDASVKLLRDEVKTGRRIAAARSICKSRGAALLRPILAKLQFTLD